MKPAPAVVLAMAGFNHFPEHPHVPFALSDPSLELDIKAPSLAAVLEGLVEAGYVTRHPRRKTYALPGVAPDHSAAHRFPEIEAAKEQIGRLAQHGDECIGSVRAAYEIATVSIEGRPGAKARDGNAALRKRLLLSLERVRDEGSVVGLSNDPVSEVIVLVNALTIADRDPASERLEAAIPRQGTSYVADGIDPAGEYDMANLVVPVFGPEGDVSFAIIMLSAARRVTRAVGGKWAAPERPPGQGANSATNAGADDSARNGDSP